MAAINWINKSDGKSSKWIATDNGKKWVQIILQNIWNVEKQQLQKHKNTEVKVRDSR
jgi:hypothetical protein